MLWKRELDISKRLRKKIDTHTAAFEGSDERQEVVRVDFLVATEDFADKWDELLQIKERCTSLGLENEYESARKAVASFGMVCLQLMQVQLYSEMLKLEQELMEVHSSSATKFLKALQEAAANIGADFSKTLAPIFRVMKAVLESRADYGSAACRISGLGGSVR